MNYYVGNPLQIRGAELYTLHGGKGEGMDFVCVRNGIGLEAWISLDRAGDISRLSYKGDNMGYFAPCGYVSSKYYDDKGAGFLKSFTAGFFTTCGLSAVGSPCTDEGEELPLHGTFSHIPAQLCGIEEKEDEIVICLKVTDAVLFGKKLVAERKYVFSYVKNTIEVSDCITNEGDKEEPVMILYHCNMGYPLLSENSRVVIPNSGVCGRNDYAGANILTALEMEAPTGGYEERCYYFDVEEKDGVAKAGIYNEDIEKGLVISYDKNSLPYFTEWKMMGKTDYVLGLEPGNCTPDGRDVLRQKGLLEFVSPGANKTTSLCFEFYDNKNKFEEVI